MKDIVQTMMMILTALVNPAMAYWYSGWQIAKYLSMENARIVRTEA